MFYFHGIGCVPLYGAEQSGWHDIADRAVSYTHLDVYKRQVRERDAAEDISRVLYPNDDTDAGKRLRLKQQYFFSSASLQDMVRAYRAAHGGDFTHFADAYAVQLNDTRCV